MKLEVKNLKKQYKDCLAVNNLSFSIKTGEITGFIGPNGSGKTTTMKLIATIENCTSGDIKIGGTSILEYPELVRQHIGYVPDTLPSNKDMTVHDYLDFFASAYSYKSPLRQKVVKEIEDFTKLSTIKEKVIDTLSKGMKQRVSVARSLISDPDFFLMDEPAAGLDPKERMELKEFLLTLKNLGKGILISSHILSELSEVCDSIVIIERGRLVKSGRIDEVIGDVEKSHKPVFQIQTITSPDKEIINLISLEPMVSNIRINDNFIEFEYTGSEEQASEMVSRLLDKGYRFSLFGFKKENLESVFMKLTKGGFQ